uniref:Kinesin motor domain-containing protein n=1 Tax=Kalanchoe fedtschenkoi TaxID=63787 RepID=A0A7N0UTC3_KALFE
MQIFFEGVMANSVSALHTDVNVVPEQEQHELEEKASNLEREISQLRLKLKYLNGKRREALNRILDIKGSIRVFSRIRPFLQSEKFRHFDPISVESEKILVQTKGSRKDFRFDKVFAQDASQDDVYAEVVPILKSALDGHNVCVIAYGQTGTGKTITMDGMEKQPGIVPRALKDLLSEASADNSSSYSFSMSMLEVYMGSLRDLLEPKLPNKLFETSRRNLTILTDKKGAVEIEGLTEVSVHDFETASWCYNKGRLARSTAWTNVNEASSRSHCLMRITISHFNNATKDQKEVSKLWMVDLGGSERCLKTGATGHTLDEGRAINLSLSALSDVIVALRRKRRHIPYRNSKLTQILKDSLGVSSKVLIIVHLSPREEDVAETICSLGFGTRARAVDSDREISEDMRKQKEKQILMIEDEMRNIEGDRQKVVNQIKHAEFLLSDNSKVFTAKYGGAECDSETPAVISKGNIEHQVQIPKMPKKVLKRSSTDSLPRFMTSTMASRQRETASGKGSVRKLNTPSSRSRNSFPLMSFQSVSDIHLRIQPRSANKKTRYGEVNAAATLTQSPNWSVSDYKMESNIHGKLLTSPNPILRATLSHHRRRMSDLI